VLSQSSARNSVRKLLSLFNRIFKLVNEAAPTEMKGSMGAMSQLMCTAGIFLPALLGLPIPNDPENYADEFIVTSYWRVVWGMPLIFVVL